MNNSLQKEIKGVKNIRNSVRHIIQMQEKMEKSQDVLSTVVKNYTDKIEALEIENRDLKNQNNYLIRCNIDIKDSQEYIELELEKNELLQKQDKINNILNKFKFKDLSEIESNLDDYFSLLNDYEYKSDIELREDLNKYIETENEMVAFFSDNELKNQDDLYNFVKKYRNHKCNESERLLSFEKPKEAVNKEDIIINNYLKNNIFNHFKINNLEELFNLLNKKPEVKDIDVEASPKYKEIENKFNRLKIKLEEKQENIEKNKEDAKKEIIEDKKEELEKYISEINTLKKENENIKTLKKLIENNNKELNKLKEENDKLKKVKKEKLQQSRSNEKNEDTENIINELPFENCPIICMNNVSDYKISWKRHISTEIYKIIKDNKFLWEKINKDENIDKKTLNEAIDYIILKRGMKNADSNRNYIRKMINRSLYMYNEYDTKLKYIYFSLNDVIKLNEGKWQKWKKYLENKILELQQSRSFEENKKDNKIDIKSIVSGYLKEDIVYDIVNKIKNANSNLKNNIENKKLKNTINIKTNMDNVDENIKEIFKKVREMRNNHIIKNDLHINVLRDKDYQNLTFKNCIGIFNKELDNNQTFNKMLDIAIKTDITPDSDENYELLSYKEYKNKLINIKININPEIKLDKEENILFEKYLEFVLKSYMYSKYNKEMVPKECIIIKNELIKKFTN